jgi:deoxyribonuclease V
LTFRELPPIERVLKRLKRRPNILMVDGNGILHPLGIGLASHVGVKLRIPTIGVAKKKLLGDVQGSPRPGKEAVPVTVEGRHVGFAMVPTVKSKRPIYISPGNRVSLHSSVNIVKRFCKYRIPEPIRQADILSRKMK